MDLIVDFLINIAASIAFFVLGFLASRGYRWWSDRPFREIWKHILVSKKALVVFTTRTGPKPSSTPRISFFETKAFSEVDKLLSRLGYETVPVSGFVSREKVQENNVIMLGSPVANQAVVDVWDEISPELPYEFHVEGQFITRSSFDFHPGYENDLLVRDYCLIIRRKNPYNCDHGLIISAGCHGFGTYGGIKALTERTTVKQFKKMVGSSDFIALIEVRIKEELITSLKILECFPLIDIN